MYIFFVYKEPGTSKIAIDDKKLDDDDHGKKDDSESEKSDTSFGVADIETLTKRSKSMLFYWQYNNFFYFSIGNILIFSIGDSCNDLGICSKFSCINNSAFKSCFTKLSFCNEGSSKRKKRIKGFNSSSYLLTIKIILIAFCAF